MRTSILLIALALIPVFAGLLRWHFLTVAGPKLQRKAEQVLRSAGLQGAAVRLVYLDAQLSGTLKDPGARDLAAKLVDDLRGVRVLPQANRIKAVAKIAQVIADGELRLSGWLPGVESRNALRKLAAEFRPDLKLSMEAVQIAPHVELGEPVKMPEGDVPEAFREVLEEVRLPASLSITRKDDRYLLTGVVPREELKQAIVQAAGKGRWQIDASRLLSVPFCGTAPFMQTDAIAVFVGSLFSSPTPGDFSIDLRSGPKLKAHATAAMEAAWLNLLRPVTGGAKVDMQITRVASAFQFPDYKPLSALPPGMDASIRHLLKTRPIYFEPLSPEIPPQEAVKLGSLVAAISASGAQAQFVVAGYGDETLEPGSSPMLRVQRTEAVRGRLVEMGVNEALLETAVFDAVHAAGLAEDDVRREARKVELFIK